MKICPLLWRGEQPAGPDRLAHWREPAAGETDVHRSTRPDSATPTCLDSRCRFHRPETGCGLERQLHLLETITDRLDESEERWENMLLSLVELTERIENAVSPPVETGPRQHTTTHSGQTPPPRAPESATAESPPPDPTSFRSEVTTPPADVTAAKQLNLEGIGHYNGGALDLARNCFREAVSLHPEFVEGFNNLGLVETELGLLESAVDNFKQAIIRDTEQAVSYSNLGYVYYQMQTYEQAIIMYEMALERSENNCVAWTNLGNAHFRLGDLDEARVAWDRGAICAEAADQDQSGLEPLSQS